MSNASWGAQGILSFPIDCDSVLKHLKQDMRDDWFQDALTYSDLFANKNSLQEVVAKILDEGHGQYVGISRQLRNIPKKGLGVRYALETDFYDRFIYQSICSFLIQFYDPALSHRVLGHRLLSKSDNDRYLFKNRMELWRTFEGITHTAITGDQTLLATDLINYYENISVETIRSAFTSKLPKLKANGTEKVKIRNAIETLVALLDKWGFSRLHGLPQNRDASSFIANVVLCDVDHKMAEMGHDYYRYVDDIRIICSTAQQARKALVELIGQLRTVGMNINSSKTAILNKKDSEERVAEFFPSMDSRSLAIDTMWRSRSRRVITRSIPLVCEMVEELIQKNETQSRQFRFAVNRFISLLDHQVIAPNAQVALDLAKLVLKVLEEQAVSTDQFCRLLSIIELTDPMLLDLESFLCDPIRSIHPWQNYQIWMLLASKGRKTAKLIDLAKEKIADDLAAPEVPAIFIYARAVDEATLLLAPQIEKFDASWTYQHQRYFLLATKDLPADLMKQIVPMLSSRVAGTVKRAMSHLNEDGRPSLGRSDGNLIGIYDEISPYA